MAYLYYQLAEKLKNNSPDAPTEIDYSHTSGVGASCVIEVAQILAVNKTVKRYVIGSGNGLDENGLQQLSAALRNNTTLEVLNLNGHKISDEGMSALAAMLSVNNTLTELSFIGSKISTEGFRILAGALRVNQGIKVIKLDLTSPDTEAMKELTDALVENNTLIQLTLNHNKITEQSAVYLTHMLQKNKALEKLNLEWCKLGDNFAKELAKGITENNTLIELSIPRNKIGPEGAEALASALAGNSTIAHLYLSFNPITGKGAQAFGKMLSSNQSLVTLSLRNCEIDDAGGAILCGSLTKNKSLKTLTLEGNQLGDRAAKALGKALPVNATLLKLNLKENQIQIQGGIDLAAGLGRNQTVIEFNLSKNQVGKAGFAAGLQGNETLVWLDLSHNQFGPEGIAALGQVIKDHPRLVMLNLANNQAGDMGVIALVEAFADKNIRSILAHLDLDGNDMTQKAVKPLAQFIGKNQHLAYLRIASNHFSIQGLRTLSLALVLNRVLRGFNLGSCTQTIKNQEVVAAFVAAANNSTLTNFVYPSNKIEWKNEWLIRDIFSPKKAKEIALLAAVRNKDVKTAGELLDEDVSPYFCTNTRAKKVGKIIYPNFDTEADRNKIVFPYDSESGETLLHIAVCQEDLPMLQLLLQHNIAAALSSIPNQENKTAIHLAEMLTNPVFYQAFVDAGLVSEKRAAEELPAEDIPAAKRARTIRTPAVDAPLPSDTAQLTLNAESPARNLRARVR